VHRLANTILAEKKTKTLQKAKSEDLKSEKRILVAGGAGYLGSHIVEKLICKGHQVTVIDNLSSGKQKNLEGISKKVKFIKWDITKPKNINQKFDVILYIAGAATRLDWEERPVEIVLPNSIGNINLIKLALKNKARYVYTSSSEAYGNPTVVPTPETYFSAMNHLGPRAAYDESKKYGEVIVKAYEKEYGLKNVIFRPFNPYGPRMPMGGAYRRPVDSFILNALAGKSLTLYGDGTQTRSFCYIDDLIDGIITVMEKGKNGEIYNVGNNREIRMIDLAKLIIKLTHSSSKIVYEPLPPSDPARRCPDISKLISIGYKPKVSLEDGLSKMIEYLQK
jgi:UDP-glucuronate decarboxylase